MKKRRRKPENLFPVWFNGKKYLEKDCDSVFLAFYHSTDALNGLGGVYMTDDLYVYPDGSTEEF